MSRKKADRYTEVRNELHSFQDVVDYVHSENEKTLCANAFRSYFHALSRENLDELKLPELMRMFDERPYREVEITAQQAVDYVADIKRNIASYQNVMENMLTEETSRNILEQLVIARLTLDINRMAEVTLPHKSEYFDSDFFTFAPGSIYVDCGGYTGDTVLEYLLACPDCERIHMLEPSHDVMETAQSRLEAFSADGTVEFHEVAAGDVEKDVYFNMNTSTGDGAVSTETTDVLVKQVALDALIQGRVSMIKMDIEGMEQYALLGAEKMIRRWHPDLAICVYHRPRDLWELITYINGLNCGYEFILRHCGGAHFFDTVLLCRSATPKHATGKAPKAAIVEERIRKLAELCAIYDEEKNSFAIRMEQYRSQLLQNASSLLSQLDGCKGQTAAYAQQLSSAQKQAEACERQLVEAQERTAQMAAASQEQKAAYEQQLAEAQERAAQMAADQAEQQAAYEQQLAGAQKQIEQMAVEQQHGMLDQRVAYEQQLSEARNRAEQAASEQQQRMIELQQRMLEQQQSMLEQKVAYEQQLSEAQRRAEQAASEQQQRMIELQQRMLEQQQSMLEQKVAYEQQLSEAQKRAEQTASEQQRRILEQQQSMLEQKVAYEQQLAEALNQLSNAQKQTEQMAADQAEQISAYEKQLAEVQEQAIEKQQEIDELSEIVAKLEKTVAKQASEAKGFYRKCSDIAQESQKQMCFLKQAISNRDEQIASWQKQCGEAMHSAEQMKLIVSEKDKHIDSLQKEYETALREYKTAMEVLSVTEEVLDSIKKQYKQDVEQFEQDITLREAEINRIQGAYNLVTTSGTYRVMEPIRRLLRRLRRG